LTVNGKFLFENATELTLSGDSVTVTQNYHTLDTEGDAVLDSLYYLESGTAGMIITLTTTADGRDVFLDDAGGNLQLGSDITLGDASDTIVLISDGTNWKRISNADN
jgi:hypothetical protein